MPSVRVTKCGACGSDKLAGVLQLGSSPPSCSMRPAGAGRGAEDHYPLELLRCAACTLVQLSVIVDAETVFHEDYPYSSGNSAALHADFEDLARAIVRQPEDLIVDIGANDGTLLSKFEGNRIGVEPTRQFQKLRERGIEGWSCFFDSALARQIVTICGHAKVVTACNVLAHVTDIADVMEGIKILLGDDGWLVAENHHLRSIIDGCQWDTVYHEHLRYYTPLSFSRLLRHHGLRPTWSDEIPTHGGSFRMFATTNKKAHRLGIAGNDQDWPWVQERAS
jgi:hypothetical protein